MKESNPKAENTNTVLRKPALPLANKSHRFRKHNASFCPLLLAYLLMPAISVPTHPWASPPATHGRYKKWGLSHSEDLMVSAELQAPVAWSELSTAQLWAPPLQAANSLPPHRFCFQEAMIDPSRLPNWELSCQQGSPRKSV